jgi:hypothetical protein
MGDELHITAAVLLVKPGAEDVPLVQMGQRGNLGLGVHGNLMLIADELRGPRPIVVDIERATARFQPNNNTYAVSLR